MTNQAIMRNIRSCIAHHLLLLAIFIPIFTKAQNIDSLMRVEADTFISNLPEGLQQKQKSAIKSAINGDTAALCAVRNSRNAGAELSQGVKATYLNHSMRLYEIENDTTTLPLLIYLHGGGWTFGSINSCSRFCDAIAASGAARVLAIDYSLAPESPFPAALNDCTTALRYAHANATILKTSPTLISIGGDSAGGNLAAATALKCGHLPIRSLILFYPVTKAYADDSESWNKYGHGYGLDADLMTEFNKAYTIGTTPYNPLISISLAKTENLAKLPPTLLVAAGRDILRDQGKEFADHLPEIVRRVEFPGALHLFITVPGQPTAFKKAVELSIDFLSKH